MPNRFEDADKVKQVFSLRGDLEDLFPCLNFDFTDQVELHHPYPVFSPHIISEIGGDYDAPLPPRLLLDEFKDILEYVDFLPGLHIFPVKWD